jgi:hypothetical protein
MSKILARYFSESETAAELHKDIRTLQRWRAFGVGPTPTLSAIPFITPKTPCARGFSGKPASRGVFAARKDAANDRRSRHRSSGRR